MPWILLLVLGGLYVATKKAAPAAPGGFKAAGPSSVKASAAFTGLKSAPAFAAAGPQTAKPTTNLTRIPSAVVVPGAAIYIPQHFKIEKAGATAKGWLTGHRSDGSSFQMSACDSGIITIPGDVSIFIDDADPPAGMWASEDRHMPVIAHFRERATPGFANCTLLKVEDKVGGHDTATIDDVKYKRGRGDHWNAAIVGKNVQYDMAADTVFRQMDVLAGLASSAAGGVSFGYAVGKWDKWGNHLAAVQRVGKWHRTRLLAWCQWLINLIMDYVQSVVPAAGAAVGQFVRGFTGAMLESAETGGVPGGLRGMAREMLNQAKSSGLLNELRNSVLEQWPLQAVKVRAAIDVIATTIDEVQGAAALFGISVDIGVGAWNKKLKEAAAPYTVYTITLYV